MASDDWLSGDWITDELERRIAASPELAERLERMSVEEADEFGEALAHSVVGATDGIVDPLIANLDSRQAKMLKEHRKMQSKFERGIARHWGKALDAYYTLFVTCREFGEMFNQFHSAKAKEENDFRFTALVQLHARACCTASEIYALLRTGHASGAQARWRTLHELSVVSAILSDTDQELSERYLLHATVEGYLGLEDYQSYCEVLGETPFTEREVEEMVKDVRTLTNRFGTPYGKEWGWAAELTKPGQPTFRKLEAIAGFNHFHPIYRFACHHVHAGSKGLEMALIEFQGQTAMLAGPSVYGIEVGHSALLSLVNVTIALMIHGRDDGVTPMVIVTEKVIMKLAERAGEMLYESALQVESVGANSVAL
jgi:Family of unknown function (DUF5677)